MTGLARGKAFAGVAALVGLAALVMAVSFGPSRSDGQAAAPDPPVVLAVAGSSSSGSRRAAGSSRLSQRDPLARARARARAFVHAFLRYQLGDSGQRTDAALAGTASAPLERYLVARPAGSIGSAPDADLLSLRLYARGRYEVKASALLRYGRRRSLFEFRLRRGRHGWRVAELYR